MVHERRRGDSVDRVDGGSVDCVVSNWCGVHRVMGHRVDCVVGDWVSDGENSMMSDGVNSMMSYRVSYRVDGMMGNRVHDGGVMNSVMGGVVDVVVDSMVDGGGSRSVSRGRGVVGSCRYLLMDERLVGARNTLVLDVGVVLLVLVHEVIHDLGPAVGQFHLVLACTLQSVRVSFTNTNSE